MTKVLFFCEDSIKRQLITQELNEMKDIHFIGSCDSSSIDRLSTIYKPDIIIILSTQDKAITYRTISNQRRLLEKVRIVVIDNFMEDYSILLYLRYGASLIYDHLNLKEIIKEAISYDYTSFLPKSCLKKIKLESNIENKRYSLSCINMILCFSLYLSRFMLRFITIGYTRYNLLSKHMKCLTRPLAQKMIKSMIKDNILPKNSDRVVDYMHLFPERFFNMEGTNSFFHFVPILESYIVSKRGNLPLKHDDLSQKTAKYGDFYYDFDLFKQSFFYQNRRKK